MIPIKDTVPRKNPPIAVWTIILINALVFIILELSLSEYQLVHLFYRFGLVPARYTHPQWAMWVGLPVDTYFPYLSSMFLHGGWLHIIANMWALWIFGDNVEDRMGPVRFTIFYLLCGLVAGAVHTLINANSTIPSVGASGAIAGVMGAYLVLYPRARIVVLLPIFFIPWFFELPSVLYIGFWTLTQFFSGALALAGPSDVGGVAWWAHAGGFTAGILLQFFFVRPARDYRRAARDEYGRGFETAWVPTAYWRGFR